MAIAHLNTPRRGETGRIRVRRGVGMALLLTLTASLQGCLWFDFGSASRTPRPQGRGLSGSSEAVGVERAPASRRTKQPEMQRKLENAGPAVRFVGAGAVLEQAGK